MVDHPHSGAFPGVPAPTASVVETENRNASRSRSRGPPRQTNDFSFRQRVSADIRALRHSIRELRDRNWEQRRVIEELSESHGQARTAARETAEILRLQEDRFQQLLARFEGVAQVVSLADSRDLGFDQLRESVRTLTQTQQAQEDDLDTFLERVHDLEVSRDQLLG